MRVLLITGEYSPMQGGVGDYTRELALALSAFGSEVHVFTRGAEQRDENRIVKVHRLPGRWRWSTLWHVSSLVRSLSPDVVHIQYQTAAYGMHPSIHLLPRWLRFTARSPALAVTYHDLLVPYLFPKAGPIRWQAVLELARSSDVSVTTNPADYRRLTSALPGARVFEIPIGSNIFPAPPAGFQRDVWRASHGYSGDECLLVHFGFLNASKGGEVLVKTLVKLSEERHNVRLLMLGGKVGSSDPTNVDSVRRVEEMMEDTGVSGLVRWTGFLPSDLVSAWLLASDVALMPYQDGVSFRRGSFMATLAHGLPVVTTYPEVPYRELVHGENVFLVPRGDAEAAANAVEEICRSPEARRRLSDGARKLADSFSWDRIARMHLETYASVV